MRRVLILEDDAAVARVIGREVQNGLTPLVVATAAAAAGVMHDDEVVAAIIDVGLPDADGLDVVAALRRRRATLPILVLTGANEPDVINRAHALRAEFVCKPVFRANLRSFLDRLASEPDVPEKLGDIVDRFAEEHRLTAREREILSRAARGVPRSRLPEVLGVSENTVKSQIRSLLAKTACGALSDAVWQVLARTGADPAASR